MCVLGMNEHPPLQTCASQTRRPRSNLEKQQSNDKILAGLFSLQPFQSRWHNPPTCSVLDGGPYKPPNLGIVPSTLPAILKTCGGCAIYSETTVPPSIDKCSHALPLPSASSACEVGVDPPAIVLTTNTRATCNLVRFLRSVCHSAFGG